MSGPALPEGVRFRLRPDGGVRYAVRHPGRRFDAFVVFQQEPQLADAVLKIVVGTGMKQALCDRGDERMHGETLCGIIL